MTPARLARLICCRRAGIVDAFELVKVILRDGFGGGGGWGDNHELGDYFKLPGDYICKHLEVLRSFFELVQIVESYFFSRKF